MSARITLDQWLAPLEADRIKLEAEQAELGARAKVLWNKRQEAIALFVDHLRATATQRDLTSQEVFELLACAWNSGIGNSVADDLLAVLMNKAKGDPEDAASSRQLFYCWTVDESEAAKYPCPHFSLTATSDVDKVIRQLRSLAALFSQTETLEFSLSIPNGYFPVIFNLKTGILDTSAVFDLPKPGPIEDVLRAVCARL